MSALKKLCFIGPGTMGSHMANRLSSLQSVYKVYAWSRSQKSVEKLISTNSDIVACDTLFDAVQNSNYILSCLPTSNNVYDIMDECCNNEYIKNDCIWLDFTSGDPKITQKISNRIIDNKLSIEYIDCPISGGPKGAKNGTLTCMVGCNKFDIFEQCKTEIFDYISTKCIFVGNVGSGHTIKAINNLINVSNLLILSEGLKCLKNYGIDIETALNVINNSSGRSLMSQERFPKQIIENNYCHGFALNLVKKDVEIAINLLKDCNVNNDDNISGVVCKLLDDAVDKFGPNADYTEVSKLYVDLTDLIQNRHSQ